MNNIYKELGLENLGFKSESLIHRNLSVEKLIEKIILNKKARLD